MSSEELLARDLSLRRGQEGGRSSQLDLREVLGYTDWFVICSGNTERQTKAIHDGILEGLKHEHDLIPRRVEGVAAPTGS